MKSSYYVMALTCGFMVEGELCPRPATHEVMKQADDTTTTKAHATVGAYCRKHAMKTLRKLHAVKRDTMSAAEATR